MATRTLPDVSSVIEHADDAARAAAERLASARDSVLDQAATKGSALREQAAATGGALRGQAAATGEALREGIEHAEPVVRQARDGLWRAIRALLVGLTALPRLAAAAVSGLSSTVEDVTERRADVGERVREAAGAVPPSRSERRRTRMRTSVWIVAGFGVGLGVGWLLGRRNAAASGAVAGYGEATDGEATDDEPDDDTLHLDVSANGPTGSSTRTSGADQGT